MRVLFKYVTMNILFMGFSRQDYWSGLPFPSPTDHVLSELSTMTHLSWVALHSMAHISIELDKAVIHGIHLVSFLWLWFSLRLPTNGWGKEACRSSLMGVTDCGGNWILFWWVGPCSVNLYSNFLLMGWAVLPPCCLVWGQTMVGVRMSDGGRLPKDLCRHCCIQCPWPCSRPLLTHASAKDSWTLTGKSGSYQHNWFYIYYHLLDFPGGSDGKVSA